MAKQKKADEEISKPSDSVLSNQKHLQKKDDLKLPLFVSRSADMQPLWIAKQADELERYRAAVHRMGEDILRLNAYITQIQEHNQNLKRQLASYDNITDFHLETSNIDGISKAEFAEQLAALHCKHTSQSNELAASKEKILKLQNDIIQKNDQIKEFLVVFEAHESQQKLVQKLQAKAKKSIKLEDLCIKQEKVIEYLQKILDKQLENRKTEAKKKAENTELLIENEKLRQECEQLKEQLQQEVISQSFDPEKEELNLVLEHAETRIKFLENQLLMKSHEWEKEKADLLIQLNESRNGFVRGVEMAFPLAMKLPSTMKGRAKSNQAQPKASSSKYHTSCCQRNNYN